MNTPTPAKNSNAAPEQAQNYVVPTVNIYETEDGYLVEADMPGVTRDGLEIYLDQNELTLLGRRGAAPKLDTVRYRESSSADFRRVFELHPEIDTQRITARIDQGVLTLQLGRREEVKPRRIDVTD